MSLPASVPSHANRQPARGTTVGRKSRKQELFRLRDEMTRSGLARELERVHFTEGQCMVSLDPGVRDYLLRLLRPR